ncbi:hypothetical protein ANO11243_073260 [Dothideomycetidae sp. 11243]|nr:hypothetical protein ANO11243_073260 [fungal sp. No.11243]
MLGDPVELFECGQSKCHASVLGPSPLTGSCSRSDDGMWADWEDGASKSCAAAKSAKGPQLCVSGRACGASKCDMTSWVVPGSGPYHRDELGGRAATTGGALRLGAWEAARAERSNRPSSGFRSGISARAHCPRIVRARSGRVDQRGGQRLRWAAAWLDRVTNGMTADRQRAMASGQRAAGSGRRRGGECGGRSDSEVGQGKAA